MADVLLTHFLKGYLEGRLRERQEQEEQRRLEQQQSVVLAQFLESVKQREREDQFRAFQMEMSKRQMELSERQQVFMERHYTIMQDIQKADLQLRQEQNADRRMVLGLQIQGHLFNLLDDTIKMFGDPKRAVEFLRKNPDRNISEWANSINPDDTNWLAKQQALSQIKAVVSNWQGLNMPSDAVIKQMIKGQRLENILTVEDVKSLFAVQVAYNQSQHAAKVSLMEAQGAIERKNMAYRASLEAKLSAFKQAQTEKMNQAMANQSLFNLIYDVTPIHKALSGSVLLKPDDITKAIWDIESSVAKTLRDNGFPTDIATFYTLSGLYTFASAKPNVPEQVMYILEEYRKNRVILKGWYRGAEALASLKLGRPAKPHEVKEFVIQYGTRVTGNRETSEKMWRRLNNEPEPLVIKSAK
jgi:hypothetical protein